MTVMGVFVLIFVIVLAGAPVLSATLIARRLGQSGGWLVWPWVAALLFSCLMWMGYGRAVDGAWPGILSILSGGYVGSVGLLLALLVFGKEPKPGDEPDRKWPSG